MYQAWIDISIALAEGYAGTPLHAPFLFAVFLSPLWLPLLVISLILKRI